MGSPPLSTTERRMEKDEGVPRNSFVWPTLDFDGETGLRSDDTLCQSNAMLTSWGKKMTAYGMKLRLRLSLCGTSPASIDLLYISVCVITWK